MLNNAADVSAAISKMIEDNDSYKKQLAEAFKEKTLQYKNELLSKSVTINGHNVIKLTEAPDFTMLRDAATMLQREAENLVITAALELEGKAQLLLMYSHDLVVAGKNAGADIREAAKHIQGGGGGQPGLAVAGGKNVAGLERQCESCWKRFNYLIPVKSRPVHIKVIRRAVFCDPACGDIHPDDAIPLGVYR